MQCIGRIATTQNVLRNLNNHSAQKLQSICSFAWSMILLRDLSSGLHLVSLRVLLVQSWFTQNNRFSHIYLWLHSLSSWTRTSTQQPIIPTVRLQPPQIDTDSDSTDSRNAIQSPDQSQSKMTSPTTWAITRHFWIQVLWRNFDCILYGKRCQFV